MATRIVHLSDLHCPARSAAQAEALINSVIAAKPDFIVVTGDLTRRGRNSEFATAAALLVRLPGQKLVVPGNHDVPLSGIFHGPFLRFLRYFPDQPLYLESSDVVVIGLNTALGSRISDWSLGYASRARVGPVEALLREKLEGRLGIVACHHPLRPHSLDIRRSTTARGLHAFDELAAVGMRLLLHGHLHRTSKACVEVAGSLVCELCANTALSDRERAGAAGYNIIDVTAQSYTVTAVSWDGEHYALLTAL